MNRETWVHKRDPWEPVAYDDDVILAALAFDKGVANAQQQLLLKEWFRYTSAADDWAFRPGPEGQQYSMLIMGRQFVWKQFAKLLHPALTPKAKRSSEELNARVPRPIERPPTIERPVKAKRTRKPKDITSNG